MKMLGKIKIVLLLMCFFAIEATFAQTTFTITTVNPTGPGSCSVVLAQAKTSANAGNNVIVYMNAPGLCLPSNSTLLNHNAGSITIDKHPNATVEQGFAMPNVNNPASGFTITNNTSRLTVKNIKFKNFKDAFFLYGGRIIFDNVIFENYSVLIWINDLNGHIVEQIDILNCTFSNLNPPTSNPGAGMIQRGNNGAIYSDPASDNHFYFKNNTFIDLPGRNPQLNITTNVVADKLDIQIDHNTNGGFAFHIGHSTNSPMIQTDYLFSVNVNNNELFGFCNFAAPCGNWVFDNNHIDATNRNSYLSVDYSVWGVNDFSMVNNPPTLINSNNTYTPTAYPQNPNMALWGFFGGFNGNQEPNTNLEVIGLDLPGSFSKVYNVSIRKSKIYSSDIPFNPIWSDYDPQLNCNIQLDNSNPNQQTVQIQYRFDNLYPTETNDEKYIDFYRTNSNGDLLEYLGELYLPVNSGLQNGIPYNYTLAVPSGITLNANERIAATITSLQGPAANVYLGTSVAYYSVDPVTVSCEECYGEFFDPFSCNNARSEAGCGNYVVYVSDAVYQNRANMVFDYELSLKDQNQNSTPVSQADHGANGIYNVNYTPDNHPNFTYLGPVYIPATLTGNGFRVMHAYRFNHPPVTFNAGTISVFDFRVYQFNSTHTSSSHLVSFDSKMYQRKCSECPKCPSRRLMSDLDKNYEAMATLMGVQPSNIGSPGSLTYNSLQDIKRTMYAYDMDLGANIPTQLDYANATDQAQVFTLNPMPTSICQAGAGSEVQCACYSEVIAKLMELLEIARTSTDLITLEANINQYKRDVFYNGCSCLNKYCLKVWHTDRVFPVDIHIDLYPYLQTGLPAFSMVIYKTSDFLNIADYKICYSTTNGNSGAYADSHQNLNCAVDFQSVDVTNIATFPACQTPCSDCISDFAPLPYGKYVVSAWMKEENVSNVSTYTNGQLIVEELDGNNNVLVSHPFNPSGKIIDTWQKIDGEFQIASTTTKIRIRLKSLSGNVFFDDIRFFPYDGSMKSYVYDPITLRLSAELDERNYATMYEYDEEGKLIRVKKETEKGIMTIQENRSSTKKK